ALLSAGYLPAQELRLNAPPAALDETSTAPNLTNEVTGDAEPVLRGPIHEAFAETVELNPEPGMVITRKPPESVQERPPDLKPSDANIIWIPGYWGWNPEREDFLWVSGTWRKPPQGHRWMPGYWHEVDDGWQWVSGTWVRGESASVNYLDVPPESLERGPVGNAPSTDHFWVPGTWVDQDGRYFWRPGYWSTGYDNWVWVPSRYKWTPSGCIYSSGYWDYPLSNRGVLYAPYYSPTGSYVYGNNSYFVPNVVLTSSALLSHLWLSNSYGHYYYGDWYDSYAGFGFFPWHSYHGSHHHRYDPLYVHSRWRYQHRHPHSRHSGYRDHVAKDFDHYRRQPQDRPASTFREQERRSSRGDLRAVNRAGLDRSNSFPGVRDRDFRDQNGRAFVNVNRNARDRLNQEGSGIRSLSRLRQRSESKRGPTQSGPGSKLSGNTNAKSRSRTFDLPGTQFSEWANRNRNAGSNIGLNPRAAGAEQSDRMRSGISNRVRSIRPNQGSANRSRRMSQDNALQRNTETFGNRLKDRINPSITNRQTLRIPRQSTQQEQSPSAIRQGSQFRSRPSPGSILGNRAAGSIGRRGPSSNNFNFGSNSRAPAIRTPSIQSRSQPSMGSRAGAPSGRNFSSGRNNSHNRAFSGHSGIGNARSIGSGRLGRSGGGNRGGGGIRSGGGNRGGGGIRSGRGRSGR
ncbi:MAG: hypothetical protein ABGZ35_09405, partial [Planctomycetaceae bacterium]